MFLMQHDDKNKKSVSDVSDESKLSDVVKSESKREDLSPNPVSESTEDGSLESTPVSVAGKIKFLLLAKKTINQKQPMILRRTKPKKMM